MKEQYSAVNVGSVPPDIIEELEGGTVLLGFLDCEAARAAGATQATVETVPAWRLCRLERAADGTTRRLWPWGCTLYRYAWAERAAAEWRYESMA